MCVFVSFNRLKIIVMLSNVFFPQSKSNFFFRLGFIFAVLTHLKGIGEKEFPSKHFVNTENVTKVEESGVIAQNESTPANTRTHQERISAPNIYEASNSIVSDSIAHNAGLLDDEKHECLRDCARNIQIKKCHYKFVVEWYVTMSKACFDCPRNTSDCQRPHCVPGDGHEKPIVTVNRRMPGPSIQVCQGDEIIVDVTNELGSDSTSLHWHGLHQRGTPYMDGVPFLTQCPIAPGTSFRYHFLADRAGTYYYHSHSGLQRADGMFGSLTVRSRNDPHKDHYDVDDPKHTVVLTDWMDKLGIDKFVNHHHTEHDNKPYNILVNGMGKYKPLLQGGRQAFTPLYRYEVKKGLRYRFRSLSNSIQNCPIEVSVDNHTMLIIASDAHNLEPVEVHSLVIYGGERWDFIVNANQPVGVYWMKFRGLLDCDERFKSAHQIAVLSYEGAKGLPQPTEEVVFETTRRSGLQLNKLNAGPGDFKTFLTAADIHNLGEVPDPNIYSKQPNYTFWLDFDFYSKDNDLFHHSDFYPFFGVHESKRLYMPQINDISMRLPNVPPLSQPDEVDPSLFCNSSSHRNCANEFCHCTHTLNVELGSLVEIILVDSGVVYWANHPFHLHGHAFAVLGMERMGEETTLQAIKNLESTNGLQRNFKNPPIKDTVTVPDGGYTVIRFVADNPGYWLFHCHISFHVEVGMGLVFKVGERQHIPPVPLKFPKCGSWMPSTEGSLQEKVNSWTNGNIQFNLLPSSSSNALKPQDVPYTIEKAGASTSLPKGNSVTFKIAPYLLSLGLVVTLFGQPSYR